ncbi:MAG: asparaginase domain-containing protein [Candidatus Micrarchaeota archaeon]|nr:asparaginase domain-containing protein [Candidatus Micrarchaeota archaeon]
MAVRIFITGGTFDKEYNELSGELFFNETHVHEMLKMGRCEADIEVRTLMMMDSRDMNESDRRIIAYNCQNAREDKIVITHGTDSMVETAKLLAEEVKGKTIVLTGAMIPYKFGSSDGLFNLGTAIAFAKTLPHGVYIAMNGHCFNHDNVRKNREIGRFERLHP